MGDVGASLHSFVPPPEYTEGDVSVGLDWLAWGSLCGGGGMWMDKCVVAVAHRDVNRCLPPPKIEFEIASTRRKQQHALQSSQSAEELKLANGICFLIVL